MSTNPLNNNNNNNNNNSLVIESSSSSISIENSTILVPDNQGSKKQQFLPEAEQSASKVSRFFSAIQQRWDNFRASAEVASFGDFLSEKAKNGFSKTDKLKYRYVEYRYATGFAKVLAWLNLGGLGALFAGNMNEEQELQELARQCNFYQNLCKAQSTFSQFIKSPNAEQHKLAASAFEELFPVELKTIDYELVPVERDPLQTENIHTILNAAAGGKDVSNILLEYFAEFEVKKDGQVTLSNILEFAQNHQLMQTITDKIDKGYQGFISEDEKKIYSKQLNEYSSKSSDQAVFMSLARGYKRAVFPSRNSPEAKNHYETIRFLEDENLIENRKQDVLDQNDQAILKLIVSPPAEGEDYQCPLGVPEKEMNEMLKSARTYQILKMRIFNDNQQLGNAIQRHTIAQKELTSFSNDTTVFTPTTIIDYATFMNENGMDVGASPFNCSDLFNTHQKSLQRKKELIEKEKKAIDEIDKKYERKRELISNSINEVAKRRIQDAKDRHSLNQQLLVLEERIARYSSELNGKIVLDPQNSEQISKGLEALQQKQISVNKRKEAVQEKDETEKKLALLNQRIKEDNSNLDQKKEEERAFSKQIEQEKSEALKPILEETNEITLTQESLKNGPSSVVKNSDLVGFINASATTPEFKDKYFEDFAKKSRELQDAVTTTQGQIDSIRNERTEREILAQKHLTKLETYGYTKPVVEDIKTPTMKFKYDSSFIQGIEESLADEIPKTLDHLDAFRYISLDDEGREDLNQAERRAQKIMRAKQSSVASESTSENSND